MNVSAAVYNTFQNFNSDRSLFALPLILSESELQCHQPISYPEDPQATFQQALNRLEKTLSPKLALYLILRRNGSLVAITFVPYLARAELKKALLENRKELVRKLGSDPFASLIICKEIGEITDARSWDERDGKGRAWDDTNNEDMSDCGACEKDDGGKNDVKDLGYKKNRCRLCDRRMTYPVEDNVLEALQKLDQGGDCVQMSVNITNEVLQLNFQTRDVSVSQVASKLPANRPSLTFYRHLSNNNLYFIFCSPDSATVKERMKHTMALPGLVNIIAKDNGVNIDQKIEIHDAEDLEFEDKDERIGKFRSMYLRNESKGTESTWEGMEEHQKILDSVR